MRRAPREEVVVWLPRWLPRLALPSAILITVELSDPYSAFSEWTWISGLIVLAIHALAIRLLTRKRPTRHAYVVLGVLLAWTLPIALGALNAMRRPVIAPGRPAFCGGTGPVTLLGLDPIFLLTLIGGLLFGALARWRWLDRVLVPLTKGLVLLASLSSLGLWAFGRPSAAAYIERMPVVGELAVGQSVSVASRTLRYQQLEYPASEWGPARPRCVLEGFDPPFESFRGDDCPRLRVRFDAAGQLALLDTAHSAGWYPLLAFHPHDGVVRSLDGSDLGGLAGAPRSAFAWAWLGALAAAGLMWTARRWRERRHEPVLVDAIHLGEGCCQLGEERVTVEVARSLPEGAITLQSAAETSAGYRANAAPVFELAFAGTAKERLAQRADLAHALDAMALGVAVWGATPLATALLLGLR